jgi:hypothetical protein
LAGRHRSCGRGRRLCRFEAGEQHQIVRHRRGPDVGLKVIQPAPSAACQTVGSLEAGDPGLDPGAEVAQLAIDPAALDHVFDREAALLVEGDILDAARLGRCEIVLAGITTIGGDLPRRHAATRDLGSSIGRKRLASAGLPASTTTSRIKPLCGDQVELVCVSAARRDPTHKPAQVAHSAC